MENKLQSRCTGCPVFSMCLGDPSDQVEDSIIKVVTTILMCPWCLKVSFHGKEMPLTELCPDFYHQMKKFEKGRVFCSDECNIGALANTREKDSWDAIFYSSKLPVFKERCYGK